MPTTSVDIILPVCMHTHSYQGFCHPRILLFTSTLLLCPRSPPPVPQSAMASSLATALFPDLSSSVLAVDLPEKTLAHIVKQGLGPLLLGSYGNLVLYTFECLFVVRVS